MGAARRRRRAGPTADDIATMAYAGRRGHSGRRVRASRPRVPSSTTPARRARRSPARTQPRTSCSGSATRSRELGTGVFRGRAVRHRRRERHVDLPRRSTGCAASPAPSVVRCACSTPRTTPVPTSGAWSSTPPPTRRPTALRSSCRSRGRPGGLAVRLSATTYHLLDTCPSFAALRGLPDAEVAAVRLRDPSVRAAIVAEAPRPRSIRAAASRWDRMFPMVDPIDYEPGVRAVGRGHRARRRASRRPTSSST